MMSPKRAPTLFQLHQKLARFAPKKSEARTKIIDLILEMTGHFRIQDLLNKVKRTHPDIGPATVYRNVPLLIKAEVIRETLTTEGGEKLFELAHDKHHDHIVCVNCNQVFEFHENVIESAQDKLGRKLNFQPVKHRHIIYAKCEFAGKLKGDRNPTRKTVT